MQVGRRPHFKPKQTALTGQWRPTGSNQCSILSLLTAPSSPRALVTSGY